ncbi:hypothetical protein L2735_08545 [Shewanella olleyana]|uniref:hypothetical protein n=1 Tax=Shewanella olleyana TaxID=135626 RepID=UPI0020100AE1|nr:hypothetical protein [Shewanella olleyana]MCL1066852.1 hypothetical protein [Shewanella olleyana]
MKALVHRNPFHLQLFEYVSSLFVSFGREENGCKLQQLGHPLPVILLATTLLGVYAPSLNAEVYSTHQIANLTAGEKQQHSGSYSSGRHGSDRYTRHSGSSVRWGVDYNNYWGPSVGIGWSSGWNNRWHNRWGYGGWGSSRWGNGWRYPYRYDYYDRHYRNQYMNNSAPRSNYVEPVTQVEPPKRTTTSIQYAKGLTQLPENARVIQRDGQTLYEWDGKEYYFDWSTERYFALEAKP